MATVWSRYHTEGNSSNTNALMARPNNSTLVTPSSMHREISTELLSFFDIQNSRIASTQYVKLNPIRMGHNKFECLGQVLLSKWRLDTAIVMRPLKVKTMPNAIEPYFSLLGPVFLQESFPQNRQMTTEALNIASKVSRADAKTEELSVVTEPKNEVAQRSTETTRLAIETLIAAFLHFSLSINSKIVSCFFSPLSSAVNDTHGEFSKTLSLTAGFNSALKLAANLGELGVDQLPWAS